MSDDRVLHLCVEVRVHDCTQNEGDMLTQQLAAAFHGAVQAVLGIYHQQQATQLGLAQEDAELRQRLVEDIITDIRTNHEGYLRWHDGEGRSE